MTLKLLEKDARAKQATVGALRKQLEDIKAINEDMACKFKVCLTCNLQLICEFMMLHF